MRKLMMYIFGTTAIFFLVLGALSIWIGLMELAWPSLILGIFFTIITEHTND